MSELTWQQCAGAFGKRYERAMNAPWHAPVHGQAMVDLARLLNACDDPRAAGKRALDAFFRDDRARQFGFSPTHLVKQFGLYLGAGDDDSDKQARIEAAERRYQEAKAKAEAEHMARVLERNREATNHVRSPVPPKAKGTPEV